MRNIEKYYDNTEIDLPHKNVAKFIEIESNVGNNCNFSNNSFMSSKRIILSFLSN